MAAMRFGFNWSMQHLFSSAEGRMVTMTYRPRIYCSEASRYTILLSSLTAVIPRAEPPLDLVAMPLDRPLTFPAMLSQYHLNRW